MKKLEGKVAVVTGGNMLSCRSRRHEVEEPSRMTPIHRGKERGLRT
jgi:hypothetical protein